MGTLRISARDNFGNTATKEIPFSKDTEPPTITIVRVDNGIVVDDTIYIMPPSTTITLSVKDNVGLKELVYRIDNGEEKRVALQGKEATVTITIPYN
ncbi:MAG: hypothetical protein QW101_08305 [Ignisphaera sp.]